MSDFKLGEVPEMDGNLIIGFREEKKESKRSQLESVVSFKVRSGRSGKEEQIITENSWSRNMRKLLAISPLDFGKKRINEITVRDCCFV